MLIFGTTEIRYLRSYMANNRYRYLISNVISILGFTDVAISWRLEVGQYDATATVTSVSRSSLLAACQARLTVD